MIPSSGNIGTPTFILSHIAGEGPETRKTLACHRIGWRILLRHGLDATDGGLDALQVQLAPGQRNNGYAVHPAPPGNLLERMLQPRQRPTLEEDSVVFHPAELDDGMQEA